MDSPSPSRNFDEEQVFELGDEHWGAFTRWAPDRTLNPRSAHLPDVERYAMTIYHKRPDNGQPCAGAVTFAGAVQREIEPDKVHVWAVESWDPLTIAPSVLCGCGDHGFIREGRWVRA